MITSPRSRRPWTALVPVLALLAALLGAVVGSTTAQAAGSLPCDIYGAAGTPCVAAHSTVRALYSAYTGPLYQVRRASDSATTNIVPLAAGGIANAAAQDSFCANTTCVITVIYDQSPQHNDLTPAPGGGANPNPDNPAPANALPISIGGHTAYGVEISAGMGYRNDTTHGIAVNGQPEGMYMVTSGTHVNNRCCFDYGNAEVNNHDTGDAHMDAINFGTECWFSPCNGSGPWVQADLENGLFESNTGGSQNTADTGNRNPYVTAMLKNNGQNFFALKDGNAQSGGLTTEYSGALPSNYQPMHQEGAIILGIGGDNSNGSIGSFFEGVMTAGVPTDAADNAVQADITATGYGTGGNGVAGGTLTPGSAISLRATTSPCCTSDYLRHQDTSSAATIIGAVSSTSSAQVKGDATWIVRPGLADQSCVSFESANYPGDFLRHYNFVLNRNPDDGSAQFAQDATFCAVQPGNSGLAGSTSFRSVNYTTKYIRHYNFNVYVASDGGSNAWDTTSSWAPDTTWVVSQPWAP